jgi:hypothetical protein
MKVKFAQPKFEQALVEGGLKDGYWLDSVDLNGDGKLDLVASGLAVGEIVWYENPGWKKHIIGQLSKPVAMDHIDIDGDGREDLVVCHDYGECMYHCQPQDGKISWLRNPGDGSDSAWEQRFIADLMATHRVRFGYFTQHETPELMGLPVVGPEGGMSGVHKPVRVMLYRRPDDVRGAESWKGELIDGESFRIIHDVVVGKWGGSDALDSVMLATEEGVCWFRYEDGAWKNSVLGTGELTEYTQTHFKGTGNIAFGRVEDDPYAYIAAIEPFHGNVVAVYTKEGGGRLDDARWRRTVLDVYGDPNESDEGPGHHVMAADFDGDGDDEFLVALRGPWPWQGVFYYKCIDVENAVFTKFRVSSASAARIALGDFDGDGRIDFATTGYYTPGYFLCDDPRVLVYYNRIDRSGG